jgi:hypothetical protein
LKGLLGVVKLASDFNDEQKEGQSRQEGQNPCGKPGAWMNQDGYHESSAIGGGAPHYALPPVVRQKVVLIVMSSTRPRES